MRLQRIVFLTLILVFALSAGHVAAQTHTPPPASDDEVGIDEQLGNYVTRGLGFLEANGDSIYLDDLIDKPIVLTLVYYHCPSICMPLLNGVAEVVERTDLDIGKDYRVVTVSFDKYDNPKTASRVKDNITTTLGDDVPADAWLFLTADSVTIDKLTDSVGFRVKRVDKDFAHGSALIVIAPDGKIVRYLYGLVYAPFDLKMAVAEATKGKVAPSISRVLRFCFSYDPEGREYVFNLTRVVGALVLIFAAVFVITITLMGKKRRKEKRV